MGSFNSQRPETGDRRAGRSAWIIGGTPRLPPFTSLNPTHTHTPLVSDGGEEEGHVRRGGNNLCALNSNRLTCPWAAVSRIRRRGSRGEATDLLAAIGTALSEVSTEFRTTKSIAYFFGVKIG